MEVKIQKEITSEKVEFTTMKIEKETSTNTDEQHPPDVTPHVTTTTEQFTKEIETALLNKVQHGDRTAYFPLGQFYFEQELYDKSALYFERCKTYDLQAVYQLGIMYYDGLGCKPKPIKGVKMLLEVAKCDTPEGKHLLHAAQYNIGRACFQGHGVDRQSDKDAERWWLMAASDGDPSASIKAQSTLGLFYSSESNMDLKKAFFWHSEACGNGSLESQGALGAMYLFGIGVNRNLNNAYICLKEASERGNIYAMGLLISHYYDMKLFTKAADLAGSVAQLNLDDTARLARDTDCLLHYVHKAVSLASFYYGRCLQEGHGIKKDPIAASVYYSKSFLLDNDLCAHLQDQVRLGLI